MATQVKLYGVKRAARSLNNIIKDYRTAVMVSLARNLLSVRKRAAKDYVIKKYASLKREMRPYVLAKKQPSSPVRLTERKGLLLKMLLDGVNDSVNTWKGVKTLKTAGLGTNKRISLKTRGFTHSVKVSGGFKTDKETYTATMKTQINSTDGLINTSVKKFKDLEGNDYKTSVSRETKQTLFMRFMHERGIRGRRRQFLEPSLKREVFTTQAIISEKIGRLGKI